MTSLFRMRTLGIGAITFLGSAGALAQSGGGGGTLPDYNFDLVTIGAPGNAPFMGPSPYGLPTNEGRGRVDYTYRIGRTEVTTAQWMEFVNAFAGTAGPRPLFTEYIPVHWGVVHDPAYQGPGERWAINPSLPNAAMLPVHGIWWRSAAMYCNWLHNGKGSDPASLVTGAYDTTTWGDTPPTFTDAPTHLPGARFWIPTLDEWLKATHYDPNRHGNSQGGWWLYPNCSDTPLISGPPGIGQTSAGWDDPNIFNGQWLIPLGAYPQVVSPWGLLDVSGGAPEWTEEVVWPDFQYNRGYAGSWAGGPSPEIIDHVSALGSMGPSFSPGGLRIATSIPAPGIALPLGIICWYAPRTRRSGLTPSNIRGERECSVPRRLLRLWFLR